jgi:hypothetical protein
MLFVDSYLYFLGILSFHIWCFNYFGVWMLYLAPTLFYLPINKCVTLHAQRGPNFNSVNLFLCIDKPIGGERVRDDSGVQQISRDQGLLG